MKNIKKAFTLVELLVVITILSILSVVAYQSFGGVTDKAHNATKKENILSISKTLQLFQADKHYYPMPQAKTNDNLWGYDSNAVAQKSNIIKVNYNDQEVLSIKTGNTDTYGGGKIMNTTTPALQIGAKGVFGTSGSFYIKKDIYDTQLGNIKLTGETDKKMIDYGIGKYTYAIYAKASASNWNPGAQTGGKYYELATTLTDIESESYTTYLVGDYSNRNFNTPADYPESLIGLKDGEKALDVSTTTANQGIPYPINGFASN